MTLVTRRSLIAAAGAGAIASWSGARAQTQVPDTAKIVVGFVPGGLTDILARRVAEKMRGGYAPNMLVENKPGASGQIAIAQVKDSPADGTVLLLTHSSPIATSHAGRLENLHHYEFRRHHRVQLPQCWCVFVCDLP